MCARPAVCVCVCGWGGSRGAHHTQHITHRRPSSPPPPPPCTSLAPQATMPATTVIDYAAGGEKRFDKAVVNSVNAADGFTTMQITMKPGFDWMAEISPKLPGCPKWCPATHFGFLKVRPSHAHAHAHTRACAQPHAV